MKKHRGNNSYFRADPSQFLRQQCPLKQACRDDTKCIYRDLYIWPKAQLPQKNSHATSNKNICNQRSIVDCRLRGYHRLECTARFSFTALYNLSASDNWLDSPFILFSDEGCDETNSRFGLLLSLASFQRLKLAKGESFCHQP